MKAMRRYSIYLGLFLALGCSPGHDGVDESSNVPGGSENEPATTYPAESASSVGDDSLAGESSPLEGAEAFGSDPGASVGVEANEYLQPGVAEDGTAFDDDSVPAAIDEGEAAFIEGEEAEVPVLAEGSCCPNGDCLCHGDPPLSLSNRLGPFRTATLRMSTGTAHYPTNAEPPFAGVAICGGFLNSGPEMASWARFYASWGIVTVITSTGIFDFPDLRGRKLLASIEELKRLNGNLLSPLGGKMSNRYGTSGYSMGGGGTTLATRTDRTLKTSVGLAAWGPTGLFVQTPTLFLCGDIDIIAPCGGSQGAYNGIANTVPKMLISIPLSGHLAWFGPNNTSGGYALAFQKMYLEGDTRWKALLTRRPALGNFVTNIR